MLYEFPACVRDEHHGAPSANDPEKQLPRAMMHQPAALPNTLRIAYVSFGSLYDQEWILARTGKASGVVSPLRIHGFMPMARIY